MSGADFSGDAPDARAPLLFDKLLYDLLLGYKTYASNMSTTKTDDYFQNKSEQTAKKKKGCAEGILIKKTPEIMEA